MDRLTTCRPDGRIETTGISYSEVHMDYVPSARINDHYDMRLAQYEDTGLTPEEITQLRAELEQERERADSYRELYEQLAMDAEQSEAACGAMREALEKIQATGHCQMELEMRMAEFKLGFAFNRKEYEKKKCKCSKCLADKALSSTAGAELLKRVRVMEKALELACAEDGLCPHYSSENNPCLEGEASSCCICVKDYYIQKAGEALAL